MMDGKKTRIIIFLLSITLLSVVSVLKMAGVSKCLKHVSYGLVIQGSNPGSKTKKGDAMSWD